MPARFYRWRERDFLTVLAYELQPGDEIAYGFGGDLRYGAIPLDGVTVTEDGVLLQYSLPVGALAQSTPNMRIAVFWQGRTPLIQIHQDLGLSDRILIRRT